MHARRFDALVRLLAASGNRRAALAALVAVPAAVGLAEPPLADAKKKKPKKKPTCAKPNTKCGAKGCCKAGSQVCANGKCAAACQFTKTATTWTLKGDCTTTRTIEIPDGVALDGNGKTILCSGASSGYEGACVKALAVRALVLDGGKLIGSCDSAFVAGIQFFGGSGEIRDSALRNFACATGIEVLGGSLTIRGVTIAKVLGGVFFNGGGTVTADDNTVEDAITGFFAVGLGVSLVATNNTIIGPGLSVPDTVQGTTGIQYSDGATGTVEGNAISNFLDVEPGFTSCGIRVDANAGAVTIGTNTFPDPPGNEQNICDNRESSGAGKSSICLVHAWASPSSGPESMSFAPRCSTRNRELCGQHEAPRPSQWARGWGEGVCGAKFNSSAVSALLVTQIARESRPWTTDWP